MPSRRRPSRVAPPLIAAAAAATIAGCALTWYAADADHEVHGLLSEYDERALAGRAGWIIQPTTASPEAEENARIQDAGDGIPAAAPDDEQTEPLPERPPVDLFMALEMAVAANRDYQTRRETLYRQGLSFSLVRYNFGPILNATVAYIWADGELLDRSNTLTTSGDVSTILPTGGDLSLRGDLSGSRFDDPGLLDLSGDRLYDSTVEATLSQPLLRGAGYESSHESLTQAANDLMYEVRDFELFRQDFSIRVASDFYNLVRLRTQRENDRLNYEGAVDDHARSRVLRQLDRISDDELFLARRREIDAEDRYLVSQTNYTFALDDFKILLGLPVSVPLKIVDVEPPFTAVRLNADSAVAAAHHNRLDLLNARGFVEDAERRVRVAANGLLPDLDVSFTYGFDGLGPSAASAAPDTWRTSVGATFDLPLDRQSERNTYRATLIDREAARRNLDQTLDEIERDIRDQIRSLRRLEKQIDLQKLQIEKDRRAVAISQIRYESGDVQARDLLEARQSVTDAQNALIQFKVQHFIASLRLRRNMGVLFIDDKGMWR